MLSMCECSNSSVANDFVTLHCRPSCWTIRALHRDGPTDAATMTKSFAIQEEDKGSKRRMENLPTVNGVGITDSNQSGSGQIMRITVAVVHEEVEQKL